MGILMGALGGLGEGLADVGRRNQIAEQQREESQRQMQQQEQLTRLRDELELNRQKSLADYQEQKREAPAQRFGIIARAKAEEEVPMEAAPVTEVNDSNFKGSIGEMDRLKAQMNAIIASPEKYSAEQIEDAKGAIAAMDSSIAKQGEVNKSAVEGKTRKRSADETVNAAYSEALINDPTAAMAMHPVLREARADKKTDADIRDRNARADRLERKQDLQIEYQMAKEERLMTYQENQQRYQEKMLEANSEREKQSAINGMRKSTEGALGNVESELRSLRKDLADAGIDPNKKAVLETQKRELENEAKRYRSAMANNGFDLPEQEKEKPTAASIDYLNKNRNDPSVISMFESKFGVPAANYLNQQPEPKPQPKPSGIISAAQDKPPADNSIDLTNDVVLSSLKSQLSGLDKNDPKNVQKIMAIGTAINDRKKQLTEKYGRLSNIKFD